jgi:hypothetical protein
MENSTPVGPPARVAAISDQDADGIKRQSTIWTAPMATLVSAARR